MYKIHVHLYNQDFISNPLSYIPFTTTTDSRHYHTQKFTVLWMACINALENVCEPILCFTNLTATLDLLLDL